MGKSIIIKKRIKSLPLVLTIIRAIGAILGMCYANTVLIINKSTWPVFHGQISSACTLKSIRVIGACLDMCCVKTVLMMNEST